MKYLIALLALAIAAPLAEARGLGAVSRSVSVQRVVQRNVVQVQRVKQVVQVQKVVQQVQVQRIVQQAYCPAYAAQIVLPVTAYYAAPLVYAAPVLVAPQYAARTERVTERIDAGTGRVIERVIER